jgi:hypothetical protein
MSNAGASTNGTVWVQRVLPQMPTDRNMPQTPAT